MKRTMHAHDLDSSSDSESTAAYKRICAQEKAEAERTQGEKEAEPLEVHSYTPTVHEWTPTHQDTELDSPAHEQDETLGSLADFFGPEVGAESAEAESEESFDSQLTANEDPMAASPHERIQEKQREPHWSEDQAFRDRVNAVLDAALHEDWFDAECNVRTYGAEFETAVTLANDFILCRVIGQGVPFKIGITANPFQRWYNEKYGYVHDGYTRMHLLYTAAHSRKSVDDSSGQMESRLIALFSEHPYCENKAGGGETPTPFSPHFTYVVTK